MLITSAVIPPAALYHRLRRAGVRRGVGSNQSGVGRGLLTPSQVDAGNRRVEQLLGPIPVWAACFHAPDAGCDCRKPAPGLVGQAARQLKVTPSACVVIGDIEADVEAARAAGAAATLLPNLAARLEEVATAPAVAPNLEAAVAAVLSGRVGG